MLSKIFSLDGKLYKWIEILWKLIQVNLLLFITSIPIITIGPALMATYHVLRHIDDKDNVSISHMYFIIFRERLVKGTFLFLINIGALSLEVFMLLHMPKTTEFLWLLAIGVTLLVFNTAYVIDSELTSKQDSLLKTISYSLGIVMKYAGYITVGFIIMIINFFIPIFFPKILFLWLFMGTSTFMYLSSNIYTFFLKQFHFKRKENK